jgi:alkanesulfonate monooxygenase SsuD/methylene tetrahydromethanopterin reductase-like flavin-dependent oxidoreductase (luciferase family)
LCATHANVVRIQATSPEDAYAQRSKIRACAQAASRDPDEVKVLVDLSITLAAVPSHAEARRDLAEEITGEPLGGGDARFVGLPQELAEMCVTWVDEEACDGFTFLPTSLPVDLVHVVDSVVPELQRVGRFPTAYSRHTSHLTGPRAVPVPRGNVEAPMGLNPELLWD